MATTARRVGLGAPPERVASADHAHGLEEIGEATAYRRYLFDLISPHLAGHVLEIGAGRGDFATHFSTGSKLTLTDVDPRCLDAITARFADRTEVEVRHLDITLPTALPQVDSVVAINVLEHIRDDAVSYTHLTLPTKA